MTTIHRLPEMSASECAQAIRAMQFDDGRAAIEHAADAIRALPMPMPLVLRMTLAGCSVAHIAQALDVRHDRVLDIRSRLAALIGGVRR